MKSQKLKSAGIAVIILLLISGTNLFAQRPDHPQRGQQGGPEMHQRGEQGQKGPKGLRIPNLTEEQKEQLKTIHINEEKEALPLKNQVAEKEARLRTLTTSEEYNERVVNSVIDEISELKGSLMKLKVATGQEIKKILTDEQVVFFNNHIGKMKGGQGKGKGPQQGRGR